MEGNSKLATSSSLAEIGGPGLGGGLVQLIGAPFAILVDAVSFVVSSISLVLIRSPEPPRPPRSSPTPMWHEIGEGLRLVRRHPVLVPLTLRSVIAHVAGSFYGVLYTIYLIQDLHLDPFLLGIVVSAGGVGSLVGSFVASRVIARLGFGPALIWTATGAVDRRRPDAPGGRPAPARDRSWCSSRSWSATASRRSRTIAELSLIQGAIPDRILGRVNATLDVFSHGVAYPLGALTAAGVAGWIGVRGAIAIGWAGMALSILVLVLSPLPRIRSDRTWPRLEGLAPGRVLAQVFRVGDERAELCFWAFVRGLRDRHVCHEAVGGGAVPVPLAWGRVDRVARVRYAGWYAVCAWTG